MDGTSQALLLRRDEDGVATLTMNRPEARNALSVAMMTALQDAIDAVAKDRAVKVVVIAGSGPAFCAGHDLKELRANPGRRNYEAVFAQCSRLMVGIVKLPKPVIARVHGIATAAGASWLRLAIWRWPRRRRASPRRASISACFVPRQWWRCRARSGASRRWKCC
jgi:enoyl-CoA hydratase/carnithine racemase